MTETTQLQAIEQQLSCPQGEMGLEFANMMHQTNLGMTQAGFHALNLAAEGHILEIGHGNAAHLAALQQVTPLHYTGLEISELMQQQASLLNQTAIQNKQAEFLHYDGEHLPPFPYLFDGILSVNTIYFWPSPLQFLQQLRPLLKPNGIFSLVYMDEHYMRTLPFVGDRFHIYPVDELEQLFSQAGYQLINTSNLQDEVPYKNTGKMIPRQYHVSSFTLLPNK